jgi:hypothetical protein
MPLYKLRHDDSWVLLLQALPVLPRHDGERRAPVRRLAAPTRAVGLVAACYVALRLHHYWAKDLWWSTARHRPWWAMALLNMPPMKLNKSYFQTNI